MGKQPFSWEDLLLQDKSGKVELNNTAETPGKKERGSYMAQNPMDEMEQEEMTVTLTLDDGSELECVVLTIFEAGERDYIALLPMEGAEAEEGEVYLYRYSEDAEGNPNLDNIEDDDEYEIVADAFDELLDDQEFDELVSEEDLD